MIQPDDSAQKPSRCRHESRKRVIVVGEEEKDDDDEAEDSEDLFPLFMRISTDCSQISFRWIDLQWELV